MAFHFLDNAFTPKETRDTLPKPLSPFPPAQPLKPIPSPPHPPPTNRPKKPIPKNQPIQPTLKKKEKPQLTAPPIINTLSSSLLTHCTTLFALCASAFLLQCGPATQCSSKSGVVHASETSVRLMLCWTLGCVGLVWIAACKRW